MTFPVRVSCVSYLNSAPFVYGLKNHDVYRHLELSTDNPADCARKLINNEVDIGLVPIAAIPSIPNAHIISDFCISADNNVKSVLLLSDVPLDEIKIINLDYQSMTSVNLVKILASRFWKISPGFINAAAGYENEISGTTAAVVIGDRALKMRSNYKYVFDLAGEWKKFTGLPFVFACWVGNKNFDADFISSFNEALQTGVNNIDEVIYQLRANNEYFEGVEEYLKKNLSFLLDSSKMEAMELFYFYIRKLQPLSVK